MAVTITVDATWRLSRVEFNLPHSMTQTVMGYGEVLLQKAKSAGPEADILKSRSTNPDTYGSMPGAPVNRSLTPEVLAETIDIEGKPVSLEALVVALGQFFEKWRVEDIDMPTPLQTVPQAAKLTPVPPPPLIPEPAPV
jgi:hypothetical protein